MHARNPLTSPCALPKRKNKPPSKCRKYIKTSSLGEVIAWLWSELLEITVRDDSFHQCYYHGQDGLQLEGSVEVREKVVELRQAWDHMLYRLDKSSDNA
eukprot:1336254-Amphidinium_carterae.1